MKSSGPLDVAVVIVSYKSATVTIDSLRSLLSERSSAEFFVRAIVVDNASGDIPQIERAVRDNDWSSWVTLVEAPKNGGFAYGTNLGIERAYASAPPSYIYVLNPDTQVRPGALATLVRFLDANPQVGIAGGSFETGEGGDWDIAFRFPSVAGEIIRGLDVGFVTHLLQRWAVVRHMRGHGGAVDWISGAAMMIRPEVIAEIGGLDANYFLFFEETDFCMRAKRAGFLTWYVPESRVMHIGGYSTSVSPTSTGRLPGYWFESRRRYFLLNHGLGYSIVTDIGTMLARGVGLTKRVLQGRIEAAVPHFIRDLWSSSVLWKRNRNIPPAQSRIPGIPRAARQLVVHSRHQELRD